MELKSVKTITFARLSNAYHSSFHASVKAILQKYKFDEKIAELFSQFETALNNELTIVRRSMASDQTEVMKRYDALRDAYFRQVWYKLKSAENDVEGLNLTAEQLALLRTHVLAPYSLSVCSDGNLKEISVLRSFARDVNLYCFNFLAKLQISDALQRMQEANDNYETTYLLRVDEKTGPIDSSELRNATDTAFLRIAYYLNAGANAIAETQDERMHLALCARVIDAINVVIQDIKYRAYRDSSGSADVGGYDDYDNNDPSSGVTPPAPTPEDDDLSQE